MEFSFIIPIFDSAQYITECLDAIASLNYDKSQYEIIVVDGGSTDQTLELVGKFPKVIVLYSKNISISNSRNIGAEKARGKALAFIDSDCLVDVDLLWKAERHLSRFECCGSFYKPSEEHGWVARTWLAAERKESGIVSWITSGTLLVRKDFFIEVGGFNEELQTEEDEDFGRRVRKHGGRLMNDLTMASIHLGQADTIFGFFEKEVWRGMSLIKPCPAGVNRTFSFFDLAIIGYLISFLSIFLAPLVGLPLFFRASLAVYFFMPLLLVFRKMRQINEWRYFLKMYVLYLVFLMARIFSLLRYNQFRHLFS